MTATARTVTLAAFIKWEAPDGDVRLCDGGFLDFDSERYTSFDAVFGTVAKFEPVESVFDDAAEGGTIVLAPSPDADLAAWWRADLGSTRMRLWLGEVDADGKSVSDATLLADWLVDVPERVQGNGHDFLSLELMGRQERLFLTREGNVCSDRFHQTVWTGERGFENCTDSPATVAWGTGDGGRAFGGGVPGLDNGPTPNLPGRIRSGPVPTL